MGCYNDDLLFIHIPKCAGWSVKNWLRDHLPNVLMPDDPRSKLPIGHVRLADIERFTGRPPESFKLILAIVRNPYVQQLSQMAFWATRYLDGGRHVHDVNTWRHVSAEIVQEEIWQIGRQRWEWAPRHFNLTGFAGDPRCDFHAWYLQHHGYEPGMPADEQQRVRQTVIANPEGENRYEDYGGLYRFWVTVNGVIPPNVAIIRLEDLDVVLPAVLEHHLGVTGTRPLPRLNTSSHGDEAEIKAWYTPLGAAIVEQKFPWAFDEFYKPWAGWD